MIIYFSFQGISQKKISEMISESFLGEIAACQLEEQTKKGRSKKKLCGQRQWCEKSWSV